ncbi:MAG: ABC-2 transporter permease [Oscillospiraceae bacterium]|nr:ABC-2 transporter permease [Oscillospiraceae bacterium]
MKALVWKDIYVLTRQMRIFLLLLVVFAVMPGYSMTTFATVYAAMMPFTAIAYDERSKWDSLAAMMPYSVKQIVTSKYVLGYGFVAGAALISAIAKVFVRGGLILSLTSLCVGLLIMALVLPLVFRFGVEKGRMAFVLIVVVVAVGGASLATGVASAVSGTSALQLTWWLAMAAIVSNIGSIWLSVRFYSRRMA